MYHTLVTLIDRLDQILSSKNSVIQWGAPVPSFGDVESSSLATLGLNPSNREFVDDQGNELKGADRRFPTLKSLNIQSWGNANQSHLREIMHSCNNYFYRNPYSRWFSRLDDLLASTNCSYYSKMFSACHLDIVPYATHDKWGDLNTKQRSELLAASVDKLGLILRDSEVRVLIMNGRSVVNHFEEIAEVSFEVQEHPEWALTRDTSADVAGYSFRGEVREIGSIALGRRITVLGYNHNIQSSFGITSRVVDSIRDWIEHSTYDII